MEGLSHSADDVEFTSKACYQIGLPSSCCHVKACGGKNRFCLLFYFQGSGVRACLQR